MAEETFTITYDGPALSGGRMSVRDLAPALIALSDAVRETHRVTYPNAPEPALDIHALRDGSFSVDLILSDSTGVWQGALNVLTGREVSAVVNLTELVGVLFGSLMLVRRFATRKVRRHEQLADGTVRVTFDDGQSLTIDRESLILASDRSFREAARQVVAPLSKPGVEAVELSSPHHERVRVSKADLSGFEVPGPGEQELLDQERDAVLRPLSVVFTEGNKWRVSDGESIFHATVVDRAFLRRVATGEESFTKNDILRVRLRTRQWRTGESGLRSDHQILEVREHVVGYREVPLPFDDEDHAPGEAL